MRVCIVAEHASTRFGGEAILPVHYFRLLRSRGVECWMVVHSRTQSEVLELFPRDAERIHFVPDLWIHKLNFALSKYLPRRVSEASFGLLNQLITQFVQRSVIQRLVREQHIDVVHQPIPVAPRFPSLMFNLGVPVVIGPLNGGMEYPPAFRRAESKITQLILGVAKLFANLGNMLLPGKRRADVVLVANQRTQRALPKGIQGTIVELVENGVDMDVWQSDACDSEESKTRFVFLGRLVDWKALDIVIRALVRVPLAELEVIGGGPMLAEWQALAAEAGVASRVHFAGWRPQKECAEHLRTSVGLVLPSLYECGGAVVLEAMAMGKPVIATRWGGPEDYLDESCGILVDPQSYAEMIEGFACGMQSLIDSPDLARKLGSAGRKKAVRDFDWQKKIDFVVSVYQKLVGKSENPEQLKQNQIHIAIASEHN